MGATLAKFKCHLVGWIGCSITTDVGERWVISDCDVQQSFDMNAMSAGLNAFSDAIIKQLFQINQAWFRLRIEKKMVTPE